MAANLGRCTISAWGDLKAVHWVWKREGLSFKTRNWRRLKLPKAEAEPWIGPDRPWRLDFLYEGLESGRYTGILGVPDCFTRESPLLKGPRVIPSYLVAKEMAWILLLPGGPQDVVYDNGPEFRAMTLPEGVECRFIQPGKPLAERAHRELLREAPRRAAVLRALLPGH